MAYAYTTRNGKRIEVHAAAAFDAMAAEFKRATGCNLILVDGVRTRAEQARLYNGWIKRLPGFNLAAPPGSSKHEESGPSGPRAMDLRDDGRGAGVSSFGNTRGNWLAANAPRYGIKQTGASFSPREAWHYEFMGSLTGPVSGGSRPGFSQLTKDRQEWLNSRGWKLVADGFDGPKTKQAFKEYQTILKQKRGYTGAIDGIWGPGMQAAHQREFDAVIAESRPKGWSQDTLNRQNFLKSRGWKITADGIEGPATRKAYAEYQAILRQKRGYAGPVNGVWTAQVEDAHRLEVAAIAARDRKLKGFSEKVLDQQIWLVSRGWRIAIDGLGGPATKQAIREYQEILRRKYGMPGAADGIWGNGTQAYHQLEWNAVMAGK